MTTESKRFILRPQSWDEVYDPGHDGPATPPVPPPQLGLFGELLVHQPKNVRGKR